MLSTVLVPMILAGLRMSTRGRRAARAKRASAEMPRPGAMAPPRNSPRGETTSKVVAVPMSTTMMGGMGVAGSPLRRRSHVRGRRG